MSDFSVIVLAAGKGKRMKSDIPKILHKVAGKTMIELVLDKASNLGAEYCYLVVGHGKEEVMEYLKNKEYNFPITYVFQKKQLGTGDAVMCCREYIKDSSSSASNFLILCGDMPLINVDTLREFKERYFKEKIDIAVLSTYMEEPVGYGRIVREKGRFCKIVEEADATEEERNIKEINTGIYLINGNLIFKLLGQISNNNQQGEYYLTDIVEVGLKNNLKVEALQLGCSEEFLGINTRIQLSVAEEYLLKEKIRQMQLEGVTFIRPETTYIEIDVTIGKDTVIYPGNTLLKNTKIGEKCIIGPSNTLINCTVENKINIKGYCYIEESNISDGSQIGPFSHIRPGTNVGKDCRVGNFVEIKKSNLSDGVKASHLSYIGDADIHSGVNVGAGTITCNYDGFKKYRTEIGKNVFIGSDTQLVAPVKIGDYSLIAAGTTVTTDVPENSLVHSRKKQINIPNKGMKNRTK